MKKVCAISLLIDIGSLYVYVMRIVILTLALFCALISGWTAALAQVQGLNGNAAGHHRMTAIHHVVSADASDHTCATAKSCSHQPKLVHPISCSACFAVILDAHSIDRVELPTATILPALQKPMLATLLKPRFPPPKIPLSFS
ncbi:hypothetical protein [Pararhizobium sp. PWRC1-1]|uniref:hypothetical protein n=1 Tax=Pararhizobium sp. PWRC1-1 TaxID=2804566 RepID=UPI003CFB7CC1